MWQAIHTRPDLASSFEILSQYCSNPGKLHCNLISRFLRYVAGTLYLGLMFCKDPKDDIVGYSDSDHARLIDGRNRRVHMSLCLQADQFLTLQNYNLQSTYQTAKQNIWLW